MKKLLIILSSLCFIGTTSASVVSCGSKTTQDNTPSAPDEPFESDKTLSDQVKNAYMGTIDYQTLNHKYKKKNDNNEVARWVVDHIKFKDIQLTDELENQLLDLIQVDKDNNSAILTIQTPIICSDNKNREVNLSGEIELTWDMSEAKKDKTVDLSDYEVENELVDGYYSLGILDFYTQIGSEEGQYQTINDWIIDNIKFKDDEMEIMFKSLFKNLTKKQTIDGTTRKMTLTGNTSFSKVNHYIFTGEIKISYETNIASWQPVKWLDKNGNEQSLNPDNQQDVISMASDNVESYQYLWKGITTITQFGWYVNDEGEVTPITLPDTVTSVPDELPAELTSISTMFYHNEVFNQDISGWDTSRIIDMHNFLRTDQVFDQDLSNWNVSSVINHKDFLSWNKEIDKNKLPKFKD